MAVMCASCDATQVQASGMGSVAGGRAARIREIPSCSGPVTGLGARGYRRGVMYGRREECAAVDRLLQAAREGHSRVLVLRGEAGVGKSALLAYAAGRARGMTVLRAAGVEAEVELPFAALHQLLRPLLDRLGHLPAPQAAALQAAFGLAPPPADRGLGGGHMGDRFLLSVGVLSLLADAAEQRPLVCLLDDAHWLDQASADALVFAARRLGAEGIGLLFAARDAELRGFDAPGLPELRLSGLDSPAAARLLADAAPSAPAAGVRDQLLAAAGGNPLALLELPAALSAARGGRAGARRERARPGRGRPAGPRAGGARRVPAPAGPLGNLPGGHVRRTPRCPPGPGRCAGRRGASRPAGLAPGGRRRGPGRAGRRWSGAVGRARPRPRRPRGGRIGA